jgi:rotatin
MCHTAHESGEDECTEDERLSERYTSVVLPSESRPENGEVTDNNDVSFPHPSTIKLDSRSYVSRTTTTRPQTSLLPIKIDYFPRLRLSTTDVLVLDSVEQSIRDRSSLERLRQLFNSVNQVIFEDFPVEVFLQRPFLVESLLSIVSMEKPEDLGVVAGAVKCLGRLCEKTIERIFWHANDHVKFGREKISDDDASEGGSTSVSSISSASDERAGSSDSGASSSSGQLSVREFACLGLLRSLQCFRSSACCSSSHRVPSSYNLGHELVTLVHRFHRLVAVCLREDVWFEDSNQARSCTRHIRSILSEAAQLLSEDFVKSSQRVPDWNKELRRTARTTASIVSLSVVNMVVPRELWSEVLPANFVHQLYGESERYLERDRSVLDRLFPTCNFRHRSVIEI